MINRIIILMAIWVLIGEIHSVLPDSIMLHDASSWFIYPLPENYITAGWWLYEIEGMVKYFLAAFFIVTLAKKVSSKLYFASLVLLLHCFFTMVMFVVYYKKPSWAFMIEGATIIFILRSLTLKEKKQAIVKSIK